MNFEILEPYTKYFVLAIIGLIIIYVRSYIKEKAKISALKSENKKIIEQSEEIKKNFQLEIEKRKYQYESKKEQYLNFFRLLDSFTRETNKISQEKLIPIIEEFNRNYLNAVNLNIKQNETKAINVLSKKIQSLMFAANEDLLRIKQETNTIRLIASDAIIAKLNLLEIAYDKSMEKSNKLMSDLPSLMLNNNQVKMQENQRELEISGMIIQNIKNDIIELMRKELNEI